MDEIRLEEYSKQLCEQFPNDATTFAVMQEFGRTVRGDYEDKIPPLADLVAMVQRSLKLAEWAAKSAERTEAKSREWAAKLAIINAERAEDGLPPWNSPKEQSAEDFIAKLSADLKANNPLPPANDLVSQEILDRIAKVKSELEYKS